MLALSRLIDTINEKIASAVSWALLLAVIICAGNALIRYAFNTSSNGLAGNSMVFVCRDVYAGRIEHPET